MGMFEISGSEGSHIGVPGNKFFNSPVIKKINSDTEIFIELIVRFHCTYQIPCCPDNFLRCLRKMYNKSLICKKRSN